MRYKKILAIITLCFAIGFWGCSNEGKMMDTGKLERITKNIVPANAELAGQNFLVKLSDLKVEMTIDTASKEIVDTPNLTGQFIVTNRSKNIIDIQAATLEYIDEDGKPIAFKSGETVSKVTSLLKVIKPDETVSGSIDATIPRAAIKEKALKKIEIDVVYVPSPLKRETLTLTGKIE
jgi:hypothetical protein